MRSLQDRETAIPMIHHPRTAWQQNGYQISGPDPKQRAHTAVLHYSGSNNIPTNKAQWLRAMQRDYVDNRGYSLGYWQLVDQDGTAWQIRGPHGNSRVYNSAANKGDKVPGNANDYTYPILLATRTNEHATPAAIATCRALWNNYGITSRPIPHSDLDYTSCCGDPVRAQINLGHFDNTQPPPQDDDMPKIIYLAIPPTKYTGHEWLLCADGDVRSATTHDVNAGLLKYQLPNTPDGQLQYRGLRASAGLPPITNTTTRDD